jgi:hypothetical protein
MTGFTAGQIREIGSGTQMNANSENTDFKIN